MTDQPTEQQKDNATRAGWNPEDGEPPDGWDAHGDFQEALQEASPDEAAELIEHQAGEGTAEMPEGGASDG